jgi:hypothetical protein
MSYLRLRLNAHINGAREVSQPQVVYNTRFIEKGEVGNIVNTIEFRRIHLGKGVEGDIPRLDRVGASR